MSKTRIIYGVDGKRLAEYRNGDLVWSREDYEPESLASWQVMPDIAPYTSQVDGREIASRSRHREHLRQHRLIEVGNEIPALLKKPQPLKPPPGLKERLWEIANQKLRKA